MPKNPFSFLFVRSRKDQYLVQYVLREYARGRSLGDILEDMSVVPAASSFPLNFSQYNFLRPSYLLKPVSVDASNWKDVLIGSGYYKESQVK